MVFKKTALALPHWLWKGQKREAEAAEPFVLVEQEGTQSRYPLTCKAARNAWQHQPTRAAWLPPLCRFCCHTIFITIVNRVSELLQALSYKSWVNWGSQRKKRSVWFSSSGWELSSAGSSLPPGSESGESGSGSASLLVPRQSSGHPCCHCLSRTNPAACCALACAARSACSGACSASRGT